MAAGHWLARLCGRALIRGGDYHPGPGDSQPSVVHSACMAWHATYHCRCSVLHRLQHIFGEEAPTDRRIHSAPSCYWAFCHRDPAVGPGASKLGKGRVYAVQQWRQLAHYGYRIYGRIAHRIKFDDGF